MPDELDIEKIKAKLQKTFGEKDDVETPKAPPEGEEEQQD